MTLLHYVVSHPAAHLERWHGVGNDGTKVLNPICSIKLFEEKLRVWAKITKLLVVCKV